MSSLMSALSASSPLDPEEFLRMAPEFVRSISPDTPPVSLEHFVNFLDRVPPPAAVALLREALERYSKNLSPLHHAFLKFCILAKNYAIAARCVGEFPVVDTAQISIGVKDFLLFHHYMGIVQLNLHEFEKAISHFVAVLGCPAQAASLIMIDSFKKFALTSLLVNGKVVALPKYTSSAINKAIKVLCQPYTEFGTKYANATNISPVIRQAQKHVWIWRQDGNWGLIKLCLDAFPEKQIQRLSKTYLTLRISDIKSYLTPQTPQTRTQNNEDEEELMEDVSAHYAPRFDVTSDADVEALISKLARSGAINASIDHKEKMVNLQSVEDQLTTADSLSSFDEIRNVYLKIKQQEEVLLKSPAFLKVLAKLDKPEDSVESHRGGEDIDEMFVDEDDD